MRRRMPRKTGFTLIELLVVIGIIIILAGIIFPVFAQVREKGRRTACTSNLRQLWMGLRMYVDDNDGKYPYYWDPWVGGEDGHKIIAPLYSRYVSDAGVFYCPSASKYGPESFPNACPYFGWMDPNSFPATPTFMAPLLWDMNWGVHPVTGEVFQNHAYGCNVVFVDGHVQWLKQLDEEHSSTSG